jgi:hypothetical protein
LGALKGLRSSIETRQNEMMDFIVCMKERKKELKTNLEQQRARIAECFGEIRNCVEFYEKQALKLLQEQFQGLI